MKEDIPGWADAGIQFGQTIRDYKQGRNPRLGYYSWCTAAVSLLLTTRVLVGQEPQTIAGPISNPSNGRSYYLLEVSSWTSAEAAAVKLGGHLATIRNQGEQDWVFNTFGSYGGHSHNLWIGLRDTDQSTSATDPVARRAEFAWTSGEPVTFTNWREIEPNNTGGVEFYTQMILPGYSISGTWNDNENSPAAFPSNGVVEVNRPRPVLKCPDPIPVFCNQTNVDSTGVATLISSCSPPEQVQIVFSDSVNSNSILRTWKAIDPVCGESDACTQEITTKQIEFNPTNTAELASQEHDGLIVHYVPTLNSAGLTITDWHWFFVVTTPDGGSVDEPLERDGSGNLPSGVLELTPSALTIDFSVFNIEGSAFAVGQSYSIRFSAQLQVNDHCSGFFGGPPSQVGPQPYVLSRGTPSVYVGPPTKPDPPLPVCDRTFDHPRWVYYQSDQAALASITLPNTAGTPFMAALLSQLGINQYTTAACDQGQLIFVSQQQAVYVVVVDETSNFAVHVDVLTPQPVISLAGDLTFGEVQVGASMTRHLTIFNTGNAPLTVSGIDYPPGFSGNWSGQISPGSNQDVVVTFAPAAGGPFSGSLTVNSNANLRNKNAPLSGKGQRPPETRAIVLSGNLDFGDVEVGKSRTAVLTVANSGNAVLNVTGISYSPGFSGAWAGQIAPGASKDVTVTFAPTSFGQVAGNLTVNSDADSGVNMLTLTGRATPPLLSRVIAVSGNLAFGDVEVGSSRTAILTISNTGNAALNVTGISYSSGFSGAWSGQIASGASANVTVTFAPTTAGRVDGKLTVNSDADSGLNMLTLTGNATPPKTRILALNGNMAFGDVEVGSSQSAILTISNTGNAVLSVTGISYSPWFSGAWAGQIGSGGFINVTVIFAPTTLDPVVGNLTVNSDANSGGNTLVLTGRGKPPPTRVLVLSGNLAFGEERVGTSRTAELTIANIGNDSLHVTGIDYPPGFSGNWSGDIGPGSTQVVIVTFSPERAGSYLGSATINSDATSGVNSVGLSGLAFSMLELSINPSELGFNRGFKVMISGDPGGSVVLESSADLRGWTRLTTLPNATGTIEYDDPIEPLGRARFYRARSVAQ